VDGRPVMVVVGAHFLLRCLDLERFALYVIKVCYLCPISLCWAVILDFLICTLFFKIFYPWILAAISFIISRICLKELDAFKPSELGTDFHLRMVNLSLHLIFPPGMTWGRSLLWWDVATTHLWCLCSWCVNEDTFWFDILQEFEAVINRPYTIVYFHSAASLQL